MDGFTDFSSELLKGDLAELLAVEMTQRGSARWKLSSVGKKQMISVSPLFGEAESSGVGGQMTE